jgi:hypothetical protein
MVVSPDFFVPMINAGLRTCTSGRRSALLTEARLVGIGDPANPREAGRWWIESAALM